MAISFAIVILYDLFINDVKNFLLFKNIYSYIIFRYNIKSLKNLFIQVKKWLI